jgi:hypothetical protein
MSALFDVSSLLTCLLLAICTCAYLRALTFRTGSAVPSLLDHARHGFGASPGFAGCFSCRTSVFRA